MTGPVDLPRGQDPDDTDDGDAPSLDDATVAALQALLRDEPVQDDQLARERRIRAALEAAPASVPAPRRRAGGGGWLVAAAVASVLGIGGYLFVSVSGSGDSDEASTVMASGDSTTESSAEQDNADAAAEDGLSADAPGSSAALPGVESVAPEPVVDLGSFDDLAALLAAADRADPSTEQLGPPPDLETLEPTAGDAVPCIDQQLALGLQVAGVATLDGRIVVVIREPGGTRVLDSGTCTDVAG
jgi:hypothetical protein